MPPLDELPVRGSQFRRRGAVALNRRQALGLLASGITSGLAACSKPAEAIIPYVSMPERVVPGEPLKFATTLALSGFGRGAIVTSIDGRPIKIEGNPRHPASLGATDVFAEAVVLSLYDPDRSRTALNNGSIASAQAFRQALQAELRELRQRGGEGLRLLTGNVTSPTLLRQIDTLLQLFPKAAWHAYDPIDETNASTGATQAYGRPLRTVPRLEEARIVVVLDADPLGHGPDQMRNARGFAARRKPHADNFSRIYSIEAVPTLTGAKSDHRISLHPRLIGEVAIGIAHAMGASLRQAALPDDTMRLVKQMVADLSVHHGSALVLAGRALPPETHALVHWINARLQAPVDLIEAGKTPAGHEPAAIADLVQDLTSGVVRQLVMVGVNPVYDAPAELEFARHSAKARFRLHLGCYVDETAALSNWHIPQTHELEAWSDLRSSDGTASLVQPLIRPLFKSSTAHELLALLTNRADATPYELVRETWQTHADGDFEAWWSRALQDGMIAGTAPAPAPSGEPRLPDIAAPSPDSSDLTVLLHPDPCLWDGSFANNAWLQECPKPLTKQVWGNALALNPLAAKRLGLESGDVAVIAAGGRSVEAPAIIQPGIADGVACLTLGLGRRQAGEIGSGVGTNAYLLRATANPWIVSDATINRTGRRDEILTTQNIVRDLEDVRELYPLLALSEAGKTLDKSVSKPEPSLLPERPRPDDGHAWAMVIDAAICIGCNACVVACQAENNVPVVGPEEVARGRDMHWLRVDVYDHGSPDKPKPGFQPVPCMHCEQAPCEPVCPVAASVHDGEGLNVQVYNRCVGTRFCEANCPYKVRRFNFFGYADGEEYANLGLESYRAQKNPEVTVRSRGVMEKCTYCVQRISAARRTAEREDRPIGADEVRTACQSACPTRAITFGDLHSRDAAINQQKTDPRHYALLAHLGTRPRTTYLADIRNPAPGLDEDAT
ncbi:4Fe-4S dicluster domain-containing protein [Bradyrhizobium genosp. P]|uniref:4Fe-4S dicluster domain-containing protein n=1 Tax=Bradyrhizobium genosp. P TaxID=83641 RepID=UPI003CE8209F